MFGALSVGRHFLHGILFSVLLAGLWPLAFSADWILSYEPRPLTYEPILALIATVYGFLGGFIVLGAVNSAIAARLWSTQTKQTRQETEVALRDGAALFALLCIMQLPVILFMALLAGIQPGGHFASNLEASIALFGLSVLITSIPNGVLGRLVWLALPGVEKQDEAKV